MNVPLRSSVTACCSSAFVFITIGPCQATGTTHTQTGVQEQVCLYNGHKIILWTLQKGPNTIYPPGWAQTIVMGTPDRWIAGCARLDDCEAIQSTFGGDLSSGPVLGVEIIVQ